MKDADDKWTPWRSVKQDTPPSGLMVLTLKRWLAKEGWTDLSAMIDTGWDTTSGKFKWDKGGDTIYWMEIPEYPSDKIED